MGTNQSNLQIVFGNIKQDQQKICLCIDNFGVKYFSKSDINHLINSLQTNYKLSTDFTGSNYCGLTIDWDYDRQFVDISMPGYIDKALKKFQRVPKTPQYLPHEYARPQYGTSMLRMSLHMNTYI